MTNSFTSPLADASYAVHGPVGEGIVSRLYNGLNGTSLVLSIVLGLIAYDQCEQDLSAIKEKHVLMEVPCSQICMEQGFNRWPIVEDPVHWTFSRVSLSRHEQVHCQIQ